MKRSILVSLMLFLTSAPVYAEDYKGMWACMASEAFTYQNRNLKLYDDQKFFLKITDDTVTYSGKDMVIEWLMIIKNPSSLTASNRNELFKFRNKKFVRVSIDNFDAPEHPVIFSQIGTCERFY